jgi:hypothetical protein
MKLPTTIKELKAFAHEVNLAKYPDIPEYAVPTPVMSDSSTNALTKAVIYDMTNVRKGVAYRINNAGVYDQKKGVYRKGVTRKGIPDIIGIIKGRFYGIEIKFGADRQSAEQRIVELEIKAVGGVYLIVRTYRQYVESMNELSRDSR